MTLICSIFFQYSLWIRIFRLAILSQEMKRMKTIGNVTEETSERSSHLYCRPEEIHHFDAQLRADILFKELL